MIALTLFSLISTSGKTYAPIFEKSYEDHGLIDIPMNNWQLNETYKCPMSYPDQDVIITSQTEITIVEARIQN
jgi:hypothetical protein